MAVSLAQSLRICCAELVICAQSAQLALALSLGLLFTRANKPTKHDMLIKKDSS